MNLDSQIEAILFFRGEPVSLKKLSEYTGRKEGEIAQALTALESNLVTRGLTLVRGDEGVMLGTKPEASSIIEAITKEELSRDLGKAGLETLAIILYKGEASKREIDYIRGVNSGFILRNLLIRGLVKREERKGERGFVYTPTIDLLTHMGIAKADHLPEYEELRKELHNFLTTPQDSSEDTPETTS